MGSLDGWQLFGDDRYRDAFQNIWNFVQRHFIVPGIGEWRVLLARDGSPLDSHVGNPWKVCYPTGRAVQESSGRLVSSPALMNEGRGAKSFVASSFPSSALRPSWSSEGCLCRVFHDEN